VSETLWLLNNIFLQHLIHASIGLLMDEYDLQMKNDVPTTLNKEAWDNKTISRLEAELQKVIFLQVVQLRSFLLQLQNCWCYS